VPTHICTEDAYDINGFTVHKFSTLHCHKIQSDYTFREFNSNLNEKKYSEKAFRISLLLALRQSVHFKCYA